MACSFGKKKALVSRWEDFASEDTVQMLRYASERLNKEDPVKGIWNVQKSSTGVIWRDASSLALRVLLEINGATVEDATCFRKDDFNQINVAKLEAVLKGVNLALK